MSSYETIHGLYIIPKQVMFTVAKHPKRSLLFRTSVQVCLVLIFERLPIVQIFQFDHIHRLNGFAHRND